MLPLGSEADDCETDETSSEILIRTQAVKPQSVKFMRSRTIKFPPVVVEEVKEEVKDEAKDDAVD